MIPRVALRFVVVAAVFAAAIVLIAALLLALARPPAPRPIDLNAVSEAERLRAALLLDTSGVGTQVADDIALTFKVEPYPPLAGRPMTITLLALQTKSRVLVPVTPTLAVVEAGQATPAEYAFERRPDGAYVAHGAFLTRAGEWRATVRATLNGVPGFATLIDLPAR